MIQRLDELRRLLEGRTMPCPDGYHALSVRDDTLPCPTCCGAGRIPDPKWAPMLSLFGERYLKAHLEKSHLSLNGSYLVLAQDFWAAAPKGALVGAISEAWPVTMDLYYLGYFFTSQSPDQAAVDWAIQELQRVPHD